MGVKLKDVRIILKADTLDKLVSSNVRQFTIDTDHAADFSLTLDDLGELNRQTSGDIVLKVKKTTATSVEAKAAIGTRPVYDISLWEMKNGKETKQISLNEKGISIAIPYTPEKNEQTGNLYAVYVDENGKVQWITKSSYDADQKAVIFEAEHFSIYGIGYKNPAPAFTDIQKHWAADNILFVASRGLLSGTSDTTFSPNTGMTRGMFVTALGRLAGINPDSYKTGKFTDVKADAYYAPYVNWAAQTGIVRVLPPPPLRRIPTSTGNRWRSLWRTTLPNWATHSENPGSCDLCGQRKHFFLGKGGGQVHAAGGHPGRQDKQLALTLPEPPPEPKSPPSCGGLWRSSSTRRPQTAGSRTTAASGVITEMGSQ